MLYGFVFFLGLMTGFFLNKCIYRIQKEQVSNYPFSNDVSCRSNLTLGDSVLDSNRLLWSGISNKYSSVNIFKQTFFLELLTAVLFILSFHFTAFTNYFLPYTILISLLIVISFIDFKYFLIPNRLIIIGFGLGFLVHLLFPTIGWSGVFSGFLIGGGFLYLLAVLSRGGVGGGDIKLAALIGFYLGWQKILLALFFAALFGSLTGLILVGLKRISKKDPLPFGPFLTLGTIVSISLM